MEEKLIDQLIYDIKIAFLRNYDKELQGCHPYLNIKTKSVDWLHEIAEAMEDSDCCKFEIKYRIDKIRNSTSRYIKVPEFKHSNEHEIHDSFLNSKLLVEMGLDIAVRNCYQGSIAKWERSVIENIDNDEDIIKMWYQFYDDEVEKLVVNFLKDNYIDVDSV